MQSTDQRTLVNTELSFESAAQTPRSCSALAGTPADLATVTKTVYSELEAIALSREIPAAVRLVADPRVRRVSRTSLLASEATQFSGLTRRAGYAESRRRRRVVT